MVDSFKTYINDNQLFNEHDRLLLAVSGGIDSMVMTHLFREFYDNDIAVVHCNFQLRADESDNDEGFVRDFCITNKIKYFSRKFDTKAYAENNGLSIQMAARDLRYEWFEEIREKESYSYIALAHNMNDNIETFIINLSRGTGINGLRGIKAKIGFLIRPMLFADRNTIEEFATTKSIDFREDSSNIDTKYTRNRIRHEIIPALEELNPSLVSSINETIDYLNDAYIIFNRTIESLRQRLFKIEEDQISVDLDKLLELSPSSTYYFELFKEFGVGRSQLGVLENLMHAETGKYIETLTHKIIKNRSDLIIEPLKQIESINLEIRSEEMLSYHSGYISSEIIPVSDFTIIKDPLTACLDADIIEYPLKLRNWIKGDSFHPFGMKGRKKLSDFFIDQKISSNKKYKVMILESMGKIAWVVGYRTDNRFKITNRTKRVLILRSKLL